MKKLVFYYSILILLLVGSCQANGQMSSDLAQENLNTAGEISSNNTATLCPTQTQYPSQTPYPTYTPIPITPTVVHDISTAMAFPHESLDWYLTYFPHFHSETWREGNEIISFLESGTEDGHTVIRNQIRCKDASYTVEDIPVRPDLKNFDNLRTFGTYSVTYLHIQPKNTYSVYFLDKNCLVEIFGQQLPFGLESVNQMANLVETRIPLTMMEDGLVFPSTKLDENAFADYFFSISADNQIYKDWSENYYMAKFDIRKPFIQHMILALYDLDNQQFISRRDYFYGLSIGENELFIAQHRQPKTSDNFQLWVWVEDKLVLIQDIQ